MDLARSETGTEAGDHLPRIMETNSPQRTLGDQNDVGFHRYHQILRVYISAWRRLPNASECFMIRCLICETFESHKRHPQASRCTA